MRWLHNLFIVQESNEYTHTTVSDGRSSATAVLGHTHTSLGREDSREGGDYARCIEQVKAGVQGKVGYVYIP